jgi:hypothetical protein
MGLSMIAKSSKIIYARGRRTLLLIIISFKTKVLLPQACMTLADFGDPV